MRKIRSALALAGAAFVGAEWIVAWVRSVRTYGGTASELPLFLLMALGAATPFVLLALTPTKGRQPLHQEMTEMIGVLVLIALNIGARVLVENSLGSTAGIGILYVNVAGWGWYAVVVALRRQDRARRPSPPPLPDPPPDPLRRS